MKHVPGERLVRDEIFIRVRAARLEHALILLLVGGLVGIAYGGLHSTFGFALRKVGTVMLAVTGG